jgi:hypothetical protein
LRSETHTWKESLLLVVDAVKNNVVSGYIHEVCAIDQKDLANFFVDTEEMAVWGLASVNLTVETC